MAHTFKPVRLSGANRRETAVTNGLVQVSLAKEEVEKGGEGGTGEGGGASCSLPQ